MFPPLSAQVLLSEQLYEDVHTDVQASRRNFNAAAGSKRRGDFNDRTCDIQVARLHKRNPLIRGSLSLLVATKRSRHFVVQEMNKLYLSRCLVTIAEPDLERSPRENRIRSMSPFTWNELFTSARRSDRRFAIEPRVNRARVVAPHFDGGHRRSTRNSRTP